MAEGIGDPAMYPVLRDRVVVINGGATGIGGKLVEAFARQGAQVVFIDVGDTAAWALIRRLTPSAAHTPVYVRCDPADSASLAICLAEILARFGRIDVVINNGGDDTLRAEADDTAEFWERCAAIDRKHEDFVSHATVPGMKWQGRGVILNMSAIPWMIPSHGAPVYVASKAAIVGLARTFARELAPQGVRVNCLVPGAVETARQRGSWYSEEYANEILRRQATGRTLQPDEIARLALFLATDDSSDVTNQGYVIDGGWI